MYTPSNPISLDHPNSAYPLRALCLILFSLSVMSMACEKGTPKGPIEGSVIDLRNKLPKSVSQPKTLDWSKAHVIAFYLDRKLSTESPDPLQENPGKVQIEVLYTEPYKIKDQGKDVKPTRNIVAARLNMLERAPAHTISWKQTKFKTSKPDAKNEGIDFLHFKLQKELKKDGGTSYLTFELATTTRGHLVSNSPAILRNLKPR